MQRSQLAARLALIEMRLGLVGRKLATELRNETRFSDAGFTLQIGKAAATALSGFPQLPTELELDRAADQLRADPAGRGKAVGMQLATQRTP